MSIISRERERHTQTHTITIYTYITIIGLIRFNPQDRFTARVGVQVCRTNRFIIIIIITRVNP